jgi:hypothetical protein
MVYHISIAGVFAGGPRDKGRERISMRGGGMCILFRHQEGYEQSSSCQPFLFTNSCQQSTVLGAMPFQEVRVHHVLRCGPPKYGARRRSSRASLEGAVARFVTGPPMFRAEYGTKSICSGIESMAENVSLAQASHQPHHSCRYAVGPH